MPQRPRPAARFRPADVVDFVIVGSGAAGGIMARELSVAGFSVVVLEQGPRLTESQFTHDEFGTFMRSAYSNDPATQPQTFRATPQDEARPADRNRHIPHGVFKDQIPADDPRHELAEGRVGVGVGGTGDRDH